MSNTDDLRKMYSKITAPDDAVKACLDIEKSERVIKFPVKRIVAIAACVAVFLAVAIPVGASKIVNGFDVLGEFDSKYPAKESNQTYSDIDKNSLLVNKGEKLYAEAEGLSLKVDKAYFDGEFIYISFLGEYTGDFEGVQRFDYCDYGGIYENDMLINGERQFPKLSNSGLSLFENDGLFAGMLSFVCESKEQSAEIELNIPFLEARGEFINGEDEEVLGKIEKPLSFKFTIEKSDDTKVYTNTADTEGVYVKRVLSSAGGVKVETFVPEGAEYSKSGIIASVADESGNSLYFIMGEREKVDGGYIHIQYFESAKGEITGLRVYDKNITDTEGNSCVLWETENPRFE